MAESYLEIEPDKRGELRARIRAGNHEILVVSSEEYKSRDDVLIALELTRQALNAEHNKNRTEVNRVMARRERKRLAKELAGLETPRSDLTVNRLMHAVLGHRR
jgi:uncharacterized protein YegP (UPF0339 family)